MKKHAGGRPSKLTPEIVERICQAIAEGAPFSVAAGISGVGASTLREWRAEGKEHPQSPEGRFLAAVREAQHRAHYVASASFYRGVIAEPNTAHNWLKSRHPKVWNQMQKQHIKLEGLVTISDAAAEIRGWLATFPGMIEALDKWLQEKSKEDSA